MGEGNNGTHKEKQKEVGVVLAFMFKANVLFKKHGRLNLLLFQDVNSSRRMDEFDRRSSASGYSLNFLCS